MRKHTLLFSCLVLGGTLFAFVGFYFGFWQSGDKGSKEPPRQVVVSEGEQTIVAPLPKPTKPTVSPDGTKSASPISTGPTTVVLSESDQFGYASTLPVAASVLASGAKILQLPEFETFATYWLPKDKKAERVLVLLHDQGGNAYEELAGELALAEANGYGLLAFQWQNKTTGTYQSAGQVYRGISVVFDWFDEQGVQPKVRALSGIGLGSTASFEVLSLDRTGRRFFAGVVNASGGIPIDGIINSAVSTRPDPFFVSLIVGQAASDLYAGVRFHMYCGRQDESVNPKTCDEMNHAQSLAIKYGGKVDAFVTSETLGKRGLRADTVLSSALTEWFLSL